VRHASDRSDEKTVIVRGALETYVAFPPLQAPASYNLSQVMAEIEKQKQMHNTQAHASE
jgi:hypothetical protein